MDTYETRRDQQCRDRAGRSASLEGQPEESNARTKNQEAAQQLHEGDDQSPLGTIRAETKPAPAVSTSSSQPHESVHQNESVSQAGITTHPASEAPPLDQQNTPTSGNASGFESRSSDFQPHRRSGSISSSAGRPATPGSMGTPPSFTSHGIRIGAARPSVSSASALGGDIP
jgi:hypothetical protein